jgi:hypothetical protein
MGCTNLFKGTILDVDFLVPVAVNGGQYVCTHHDFPMDSVRRLATAQERL